MDPHPDLAAEQHHLDQAYDCLATMRARAEATVDLGDLTAQEMDGKAVRYHLERRLAALAETPAALCFGRIDLEGPSAGTGKQQRGNHFHIGRRHVEDQTGEPVVVDWRAPVSTAFYRATVADPMGLELRRRFVLDGRTLVDLFDERLDDPDPDAHHVAGGVPDPLLAELERARTGEMRDIVATIQAEQDVIIRAPLEDLIVVQGGPGTGKTAVGLHRAAFLLYEHRERLERRKLLVVGPNRIFLQYISQVLPSLGETAVTQATVEGLVGNRWRVRADEASAVAALKGDARMAEVLQRAVQARIAPPQHDITVPTPFGRARLPAEDVALLVKQSQARDLATNDGRELLRQQLVLLAWQRHAERATTDLATQPAFESSLRASRDFQKALNRTWPAMSAAAIVRSILGSPEARARAAHGVLTVAEAKLLHRRSASKIADERWTAADLPLLDEAEGIVAGVDRTYGHVVVDEAQDLSAMALRMVARRSPDHSMTVLGDLAQATSVAGQTSWDTALAHLGSATARLEELVLGYRVPAPILEFANRLLPLAAPHVQPSQSVRLAGDAPRLVAVDEAGRASAVADEVAGLATRWTSVGVIAPASLLDEVSAALTAAGLDVGDGRRGDALDHTVALLAPPACKGLEFDAVVVVEPARIVAEEPSGVRMLYVALTRSVQHLGIVHTEPLPEPLR